MPRDEARISRARCQLVTWIIAALSLMPVFLLMYLGRFSRLMGDDWGYFATALWLGFRDNFSHWWNNWHGSYTFIISYEILARLGPQHIPAVFPAFVLTVWLIGLTWSVALALRIFRLMHDVLPISMTIAALILLAATAILPTTESIFWYSAALRHTLPVGVFIIFIAAAIHFARRAGGGGGAIVGALVCFGNAGFSEMLPVVQLIFLSFCIVVVRAFGERAFKTRLRLMLAAGWVGSFAGLIAQFSAPGLYVRIESNSRAEWSTPVRSLPELLAKSVNESQFYIMNQDNTIGLLLMFAVGFTAALLLCRPDSVPASVRPGALIKRFGLLALLVTQIALIGTMLPITMALYSIGVIYPRNLVLSAPLIAISALLWGACVGLFFLSASVELTDSKRYQGLRMIAVAVVLAIVFRIVMPNVKLIQDFATYAHEWDARQQRIIKLRDSGVSDITVKRLSFDLSEHIAASGEPIGGSWEYYYDVKSINIVPETRSRTASGPPHP